MKYSIIIVAYKAVEHLQNCIDSIIVSKSRDYEVIIVDNSPESLLPQLDYPDSWKYIETPENVGFALACNIGVAAAKGKIICLLNPDTLVYCDWLERLSRYLVGEGGPCHAIGPVSNAAAGLQNHRLPLPVFDSREEWRPTPAKVLIGFCFMTSRKTWEEMGGMDPKCFLGCDDLDLSWRMTNRGMRLGVANDVYVHHELHKSMEANPESDRLIAKSSAYLRDKLTAHYGHGKVPSATELWGADFIDTGYKPTVSVCMIVRDEEKNLQEIMPQMRFADEIIVMDTNPQGLGVVPPFADAKVGHWHWGSFPWINDFAAARNHSLSHCTSDWVIWLDADDRIPQDTIDQMQTESFKRLLHKHKTMIRFKVQNVGKDGQVFEEFMQTRMFRRKESHWEGRIHETLVMDGHMIEDCPTLVIHHTGYSDLAVVAGKAERNLALLKDEPDTSETWIHRAHCHGMVGQWELAANCFAKASTNAPQDTKDFVQYQIGICKENMGRYVEAAQHYADSCRIDGLCRLAEMAFRLGLPYARPLFFQFLQEAEKEDLGRFVNHTKALIPHAQKRIKELEHGAA